MLTDLRFRLRALLRGGRVERELDEELRLHIEHEIDKHLAAGLSPAEAVRRARLAFGGVDQIKEDCREARGTAFVESLVQDVRYGLRAARRAPIFSLTAVTVLALSTAAFTAVFVLGYTLFWQPLPVDRPDELVVVAATRDRAEGLVSYSVYRSFRDGTTTLSGLAAHYPTAPLFATANGSAKEVNGAVVSANFFSLLRVQPALGRFFLETEDQAPDRDRVAVLGHAFWRRWFSASPDAVGSTVRINGVDFTVVGVAPPAFVGVTAMPVEVYIPMMMLRVGYRWCDDAFAANCTILQMLGRLAPERRFADAVAEMPTLMPEAWRHARSGENRGVIVSRPAGATSNHAEARMVRLLAGVAIVLLLVCCANLAGLLTAQSTARADEFTIRLALGAASGRVVRQLMTESLIVALAGGVAGIALSRLFIGVIAGQFYAIDSEGHPLHFDFSLTPAIGLCAFAVSVASGFLFSAIPAINAVRPRHLGGLTPRASARWFSGRWLLVAQVAVAVALLAVGSLLAASARLIVDGANFDSSHVALMRLRPRLLKYTQERAQRFQRDVIQRLNALPGVESVSMVGQGIVLSGGAVPISLPAWRADQDAEVRYNEIGPRYFETLRTPMVSGREFDERDSLQSPRVAVINETLARRLWAGGAAVGATVLVRNAPHQVVGIVTDVPLRSRSEGAEPWLWVPFWQNPAQIDSRLCIRVNGDPAAMLPALIREVNRIDPDVPIAETITLPIQMAGWIRPLRISATFVGSAAALAMLLSAIGLYGSLAFAVAGRTKEIGIRMALGAGRRRVLTLIMRDGMTVVVAGVVGGLALAAAGTRLVTHLIYGSAVADWLFYATAALLLSLTGLFAAWVPARRAAAIEPLVALRYE